jgi:hypothetical protein
MKLRSISLLFLALSSAGILSSQSLVEKGWKTYRNTNYNFSLRYPADKWSRYEGFDRNGVELGPRDQSKFHLTPAIRAGGAVGQPSDTDEARNQTLEEDFQSRLDGLNKYGHGRNLVVLSEAATKVQLRSAIVSTIRYEDSSTGQVWFDKEILIHSSGDSPRYLLGLHCSPDDAPVLVPLFDGISKTFHILGPPA